MFDEHVTLVQDNNYPRRGISPRTKARASRPLRVGIVVPYDLAEAGGVKSHAVHLAAALREAGDVAEIVGPLSEGTPTPHVHGFGGVVNVPANGADNRMSLLVAPWAVHRLLQSRRYDVIHLHEPMVPLLPWYMLWLSNGAAKVATFHMYAESEPGVSRAARRALANLMFPALGAGIAVSPAAADYAGRVWKRPLHVIPNGVPMGMFHPPAASAKATNGAGHAPLKLLFVGNWRDPRKGLPVLLDAHRRLLESGERVTLDIVGRGKPSARQSGIPGVTFHGPIEDDRSLADRYRSCDVFVSPATGQESFGIVLLEAMACGRPVVCSDIRGYHDVADREGACLVAPGDAVALAQAIRALAGDPERRARMGERNLAAAQRFGWDTIAQRVRDVYHEALAARAAD